MSTDIGDRIRARREALGLTQRALAELCQGHPSWREVSHYETGRRMPELAALRKLAAALGYKGVDALIGRG